MLLDFGVADDKIKMTLKEGPEPNLETREYHTDLTVGSFEVSKHLATA